MTAKQEQALKDMLAGRYVIRYRNNITQEGLDKYIEGGMAAIDISKSGLIDNIFTEIYFEHQDLIEISKRMNDDQNKKRL